MVTIGSWIPLAAGVPTEAQAQRMAEVLGMPDYSMAATILTAMLDGLTKKHRVEIRRTK